MDRLIDLEADVKALNNTFNAMANMKYFFNWRSGEKRLKKHFYGLNKQHLRNAIRTLKRYRKVEIIEDYANSLGVNQVTKWKGKLIDYKIESYPDCAECKLLLHIKELRVKREIEFFIPYDSEIYFGDITKGEKYIIDYIDSGPHCYYSFKKKSLF